MQAAQESVEQVALRGDVPVASEVDDVTAEVLFDCSLVVVILAVIPWWHYVWQHYAGAHGVGGAECRNVPPPRMR